MAAAGDPLREAKPPATDYLTYLTIVECNLSESNLSVLYEVLHDQNLTVNIGWDLVFLLLPHVRDPTAKSCLNLIARTGNPREVVLKVTEALRLLFRSHDDGEAGSESSRDANIQSGNDSDVDTLYIHQFTALLAVLPTLHARIKTKYPSRFLSTSLQTLLAAYQNGLVTFRDSRKHHIDGLTMAAISFIKSIAGVKRPQLPQRPSSAAGPLAPAGAAAVGKSITNAPDPEADSGSSEKTSENDRGEAAIEKRLIQSFLSSVVSHYASMLDSSSDETQSVGLAWSGRLLEKLFPDRCIRGRHTLATRFESEEPLRLRLSVAGQLVALAQDLDISNGDLRSSVLSLSRGDDDLDDENSANAPDDIEPPNSVDEIELSKKGALFLFTARAVSKILYGGPDGKAQASDKDLHLDLFPDHGLIMKNFLSSEEPLIGTEDMADLDSILALALVILDAGLLTAADDPTSPTSPNQSIGAILSGIPIKDFQAYLQTICLISSNAPSPEIRRVAYHLATTLLRAHPSEGVRFTIMRDVLEHCPYENLREVAVGWLKDEVLRAIPAPAIGLGISSSTGRKEDALNITDPTARGGDGNPSTDRYGVGIFRTPVALTATAPFLFPDLSQLTQRPSGTSNTDADADTDAAATLTYVSSTGPTLLAATNLLYLVLAAPRLRVALGALALVESRGLRGSFIEPLARAVRLAQHARGSESADAMVPTAGDNAIGYLLQLQVLEDALDRVRVLIDQLTDAAWRIFT